jgi:hypothetical protein
MPPRRRARKGVLAVGKSHIDAELARCVGSPAPAPAPAPALFDFYRAQIERFANDKFEWYQFDAREAFLTRATEHLNALCRLAEELAPPEQRAELVAYLSWRSVYMVRGNDGAYTLHPTIQ